MKKQDPSINLKTFLESGEYQNRRIIIQREINNNPLIIDRECFKKTPEEKLKLANAKLAYKESLKKQGKI